MKRVEKKSSIKQCLSILILFIGLSSAIEFTYKDANSWPQMYPECGGQRQSPVAWTWDDIANDNDENYFTLINYGNKPLSSKLLNDGHTLKVAFEWNENERPFFTGGILGENEYVLDSMIFHWSRRSFEGAEHCSRAFCGNMELQLIHFNRNYGSFNNSLNSTDGLVILSGAIVYMEGGIEVRSPPINSILKKAVSVSAPGSSIDLIPFNLSNIRTEQHEKTTYLSYLGSLTTPPCTENVLWLISSISYGVSKNVIEALQSAVELDFSDQHNNRPLQQLNGRKITPVWGFGKTVL